MNKHQLTQDQIQQVAQCLQDGVEIPDHLLKLLSPSFFERLFEDYKIDHKKLEKYKVPTIEYAGKRSEALILSQAGAMGGGSPLQIERCFNGTKQLQESKQTNSDDWRNLIVQGDNLQFLKTCYLNQDPLIKDKVKGKVKLVYIDPPFATKSDFGGKEGEASYADKVDRAEFLEAMRERLIFLRELLADDGSIYVHLDQKMNHYVKIVMDEIFGKERFLNEIVWYYRGRGMRKDQFNTKHDNILRFSASSRVIFNSSEILVPLDPQHVGRYNKEDESGKYALIKKKEGGHTKIYLKDGIIPDDVWIIPFIHGSEHIGYPTQKPESVIERVVLASTNPEDLVIDCFAGSGTAGAVAEKLGRRWIMCDFGKHAIYTMQKRMLEIADSKKLGKDVKSGEKYGKHAKPFCVASVGAYDFQRIMNLRENKSAYIDFVLSLFGISDRAKIVKGEYTDDLVQKFRMTNVYAQKEGNPVEIYPIWDDDYLKNIKIDQDYLEGIINQGGTRMRGKYYIIAPETCDVVGDTTIGDTDFVILSYPYKILEEMSRNFQLAEQPSSAENINDLVSSVRFYFNEDIEIGMEKVEGGLKVTRLVSPILDKDGNHYEGLNALAMLLIDKDYDGTTFRMEEAIYAKQIDENGVCTITELSDQVAVIAIDKHGNESKVVEI